MMKISFIYLPLSLLLVSCGQASGDESISASEIEPLPASAIIPISASERPDIDARAKRGDLISIKRLIRSIGGYSRENIYWQQRAIDLGDLEEIRLRSGDDFGRALGERGELETALLMRSLCLARLHDKVMKEKGKLYEVWSWFSSKEKEDLIDIKERFPEFKSDSAITMTPTCAFKDESLNPRIYGWN